MPNRPRLTRTQESARQKFELLISSPSVADEVYNALPESKNGRIISTDTARYLEVSYRETPPGKLRDLLPSWDGASKYAHERLEREIMSRGNRKTLRFMAGGWASGKTFALQGAPPVDLSWDGTLGDTGWSALKIQQALDLGWRIQIVYVQRPIELALWGSLDRAAEEGRAVPLLELPVVHRLSQQSVLNLHKIFGLHPQVAFALIFNAGTKANPQATQKLSISDIAHGGIVHYDLGDVETFQQKAREVWQAASQSGHYSAEVLCAAGKDMGKEA